MVVGRREDSIWGPGLEARGGAVRANSKIMRAAVQQAEKELVLEMARGTVGSHGLREE